MVWNSAVKMGADFERNFWIVMGVPSLSVMFLMKQIGPDASVENGASCDFNVKEMHSLPYLLWWPAQFLRFQHHPSSLRAAETQRHFPCCFIHLWDFLWDCSQCPASDSCSPVFHVPLTSLLYSSLFLFLLIWMTTSTTALISKFLESNFPPAKANGIFCKQSVCPDWWTMGFSLCVTFFFLFRGLKSC